MICSSKIPTSGQAQWICLSNIGGGNMDKLQKQIVADFWDEEHEKQLNEMLSSDGGAELRKLFQKHPEKKEEYKFKILDSENNAYGSRVKTRIQCESCLFCDVIDPVGRVPQSRYCLIYDVKSTHGKPDEILYDGEKCEFYEKEKKSK